MDLAGPLPGVPYESATREDLAETSRLVEAEGRMALLRQGDVRDLDGLKALADEAVTAFGGLDIVVANAGICIPATWDEATPKVFRDHMDINVTGVWNTVMATAPRLVERGGGSIILISSYAGKKVQPFMVHYTTSKHAVTGMTRAFAAELGAHSIRVNSVHPGAVNTPMGSGDMVSRIEQTNAANPKLATMGTPFLEQFFAEPEEVASVVAFLASDDSTFMTAEHLSVDGGAQYF
jgi:NAD(P)-dependent dehydrogenase (short-subunit alcohol dehydrogenase family)